MRRSSLANGFTLIELMIVVAIIGLLAALAIPNFLKFQARSKQSEAKANLKSVFTAQKSYYGDKQMYLDLLNVIGFEPEFNNRYTYYAGGSGTEIRATLGNPTLTPTASTSCSNLSGIGVVSADETKWGVADYYGTTAPALAPRTATTGGFGTGLSAVGVLPVAAANACCPNGLCEFLAGAVGNIDNDQSWDVWSISSQAGAADTSVACPGAASSGSVNQFAEGEPVNECNDVNL